MPSGLLVTGIGIVSAVGVGKSEFFDALIRGKQRFAVMAREGRQHEQSQFMGAELAALPDAADRFDRRLFRNASLTAVFAALGIEEAWAEAGLSRYAPTRVGLVVGGSNLQQRELCGLQRRYAERPFFLPPAYGFSFLDTDIAGICSQQFGIRGFSYSIGGASASGQLAVIKAAEAVQAGVVDACIAVGALSDLSYWECQGFRSIGAMGSDRFAAQPEQACRPFDQRHDGFIFGEACAAVVIENEASAARSDVTPYARLAGWSYNADGHRHPDPGFDGPVNAISQALAAAGLAAQDIDYVNPHGTGSSIGDANELRVLSAIGLNHAAINTTKSITGHGLSAAGAVEFAACLLQMRHSMVHPCLNLDEPISSEFDWVLENGRALNIGHALNLSIGFGGINTATILSRP